MSSPLLLDDRDPAPPVVKWYRVYAGLMAVLYVLCSVGGVAMMVFHQKIAAGQDDPPTLWLIQGGFLAFLGLVFTAPFVAAFFVPRKSWAWVYHLVLICVGLSSPCCMLASVPLMIFWLKPETRVYFGRPPR